MGEITDITALKEHKVSEVICVDCGHRWIAVRSMETKLKSLECPSCGVVGKTIETGEEINKWIN